MGMTRDELVTEILKIVGLYDDATNYEARCRTWLNQTQVRTARRHFWNDLKQLNTSNATVASQKTYSLSTDWSLTNIHKIHSIRLISGNESRRLDYIGARRMDTWLPTPPHIQKENQMVMPDGGTTVNLSPFQTMPIPSGYVGQHGPRHLPPLTANAIF